MAPKLPKESPQKLGFRWPAEWEPHAATWVSWPHNQATWPGRFEPIPAAFTTMVKRIAGHEPVHVLAGTGEVYAAAEHHLGNVKNVTLHPIETNDAWCRDHGPTFIIEPKAGKLAAVNWEYNAWGGKYPPFAKDNAAAEQIAATQNCPIYSARLVLEGGAIEGNGRGTILTTESCLLNPNRNGKVNKAEMEAVLKHFLGAENILWLTGGEMAGDDTDGHIDQLARFVSPHTVVAAVETDPRDVNFAPLQENLRQLRAMQDEQGRPLEVVELPMPQPIYIEGQRAPGSYCNFYIANGVVVLPTFDDPADKFAERTLRRLLPGRRISSVPCRDLVWGLGAVHCLTQQQPAV